MKKSDQSNWRRIVEQYETPDWRRSVWQISTSVVPFLAFWAAASGSLKYSYLLTLFFVIAAAAFRVRVFVLLHDCSHGSFFRSRRANDWTGTLLGFLLVTPYQEWRRRHAAHHATSSNLEKRGWWDFETLTVNEFRAKSVWQQFGYRLLRHPLVLFGIAPLAFFLVIQRFAAPGAGRRQRRSVSLTNFVIASAAALLAWRLGVIEFLLVELSVLWLASTIGMWLFYVQHQFENAHWTNRENWTFFDAAMLGSSYYRLPAVLNWFTGHIGVHHVHHLSPKIPNYCLQKCHDENAIFHSVVTLTVYSSLRTVFAQLWDEETNRMISVKEFYRRNSSGKLNRLAINHRRSRLEI